MHVQKWVRVLVQNGQRATYRVQRQDREWAEKRYLYCTFWEWVLVVMGTSKVIEFLLSCGGGGGGCLHCQSTPIPTLDPPLPPPQPHCVVSLLGYY
jgi:hypothetical protein